MVGFKRLESVSELLVNWRWAFVAVGFESIFSDVVDRTVHQIQISCILRVEVQAAAVQRLIL